MTKTELKSIIRNTILEAITQETNTNAKCEKCKSGDVHKNMTCDKCDDTDECMTEVNQQSLTELVGIAPMIGQNKYDYVVTTLYKGSNSQTVKSLSPIFATDEVEAKKLATAPYNRSVVTIVSVKVTNVGSVTQADIDAYNKGVKGTADSIRRFGTTN